jgi:uncharacterized repeat protein (TIGR01451 family)
MTHSSQSLFVTVRRPLRRRILKAVNLTLQVAVVASLTLSGGFVARPAQAAAASIWTTQLTCANPADQDANEYANGDTVYVRGKNFNATTTYYGTVDGNPGGSSADPGETVATFSATTDSDGYFCVGAYVVGSDGDLDDGVYTVDVFDNPNYTGSSKNDNYHVNAEVGSLTVNKVVDTGNASADSFVFEMTPDPYGVGQFSTTGGTITFNNLPTGNYTVEEVDGPNGYHLVSNDCDVDVTIDGQASCTVHNARDTETVTINKEVIGGTATASDWTFTLSNEEATYTGIQSGVPVEVFTGTYALSEQGPSDYTFFTLNGNCYDDGGLFLYTNSEENICTVTNTFNPTPANLTITKTDHRVTANPGEVLTYEITITNSGDTAATNVSVSDTVPNFVIVNSASISDSGTLSTNVITWNNLVVAGHGTKTVSFDGTVSSSIPAGTTVLHNVATLCPPPLPGTITSDEQTPRCQYSGTATDDTSVTVVAPTLSITKTNDSGTSVNPGATVTYTVVVSNSASVTQAAAGVVLTDTLPAGFTYTVGGGSTKSFTLGSINPGASVTTTYAASISVSQAAGTYTNTASAAASNAATVTATSNVAVVVPQVLGTESPDLSITKTVNSVTANPGDVLTYSVTVKNVGTSSALNVELSDTLPAGFTFVEGGSTKTWNLGTLAAGAETTITYGVAIGDDVSAGTYTNAATVSADGVSPRNAAVSVEVKVGQVLGLATTGPSAFDYFLFTLGGLLVALGALSLARLNRAGTPKA